MRYSSLVEHHLLAPGVTGLLAIVGGSSVGCELAQAFARLGVGVSLLEVNERVLDAEEQGPRIPCAASRARWRRSAYRYATKVLIYACATLHRRAVGVR
ncbi:MAG: NAD-binding protein [Actinobacteria bacterium]|nr:NAD-binding protein [Actinomycetota bacterium]